MVLNPFALTSIFIGSLSLLMMASAALSALCFYRQWTESEGADEKARAETRIHFSLLLLFTALLIRLVTWPLFYLLLQSLIPIVPGAMCIYGVTQVKPMFTAFLQILKPLTFFLAGGWLIFHSFDLSLRNHPLMSKRIQLLVAASTIAALDGVSELVFIFVFSPPGVAVSCCTVVADLAFPTAPLLPAPLLGANYSGTIMAGYHLFNLGVIALMVFRLWKKSAARLWLAWIALAAFLNGVVAYGAFKECLGPRLMNLPDHHCLYCMFQYRPVSIVIVGLFVLGSYLAIWPWWLSRADYPDEAAKRLVSLNLNLLKWSAACLLISWAMSVSIAFWF